jgi:hypothetical protein
MNRLELTTKLADIDKQILYHIDKQKYYKQRRVQLIVEYNKSNSRYIGKLK